jgi:virulence-associated protein VapD
MQIYAKICKIKGKIIMKYTSVFDRKPSQIRNGDFVKRIYDMLSGSNLIQTLDNKFRMSELNDGYANIKDYLKSMGFIYCLEDCYSNTIDIQDENVFAIIELVLNLINFSAANNISMYKILNKAICNYLLTKGYNYFEDNQIYKLIPSNLNVVLEEIKEDEIKEDILSYYDFRSKEDIHNKKKILTNLVIVLQGEDEIIKKVLGKNTEERIRFYANNFDLRHSNKNENHKDYKSGIANLTQQELIEWYNYIYSFCLNIYANYKKLKSVEI